MSKYRHEFKYLCSENDILCIQFRIAPLMQIDSHIDETMMYTIRSLYFDTYNNGCYMDNINGVEPREKFRIRRQFYQARVEAQRAWHDAEAFLYAHKRTMCENYRGKTAVTI